MNRPDVRDAIIEKTSEGPVSLWSERIAEFARKAGLRLESINWNGSPEWVAHQVASEAERSGRLAKLEEAVK